MSNDQDISALIEALGSDDQLVSARAFHNLKSLGTAVVPFAIHALSSSTYALIRAKVALLLADLSDKRAVEPLIAALNDEDYWASRCAADALGRIGDKRSFEPLLQMLKTGKHDFAAEALGVLGDVRAIEPLIQALEVTIANEDLPRSLVWGLSQFNDERVIQPLIEALYIDDHQVQRDAHDGLFKIGALAVEPLIACLAEPFTPKIEDEYDSFAERIISILEEVKDTRAVEPLIDLLKSNTAKDGLRAKAAGALGMIGDKRATHSLIESLDADNRLIRRTAARALGEIGDIRAADALVAKLSDENKRVRYYAADALLRMNDTHGVPTLIDLLADDGAGMQLEAFRSLEKSTDPRAIEALSKLKS